jgi:hypothetical protein
MNHGENVMTPHLKPIITVGTLRHPHVTRDDKETLTGASMNRNQQRAFALACACVLICQFPLTASAAKLPNAAKDNINNYTLTQVVGAIECLPHDPDTQSSSDAKSGVRDGIADIEAGHCVKAVADFQVVIDANPAAVDALWRQEMVAYEQALLTSDIGLQTKLLETAYHDMDLAIAAEPKNPTFYLMRSSTRLRLLRAHIQHKNAFSMGKYIASERQHSYDDLTSAIAIDPQYGEAYAYRFLVDTQRSDSETANYDLAMAQKLNPRSAQEVQNAYQANQERIAEYNAEEARRSMAMANAMMGLAAAAGGGYVVPIYQP